MLRIIKITGIFLLSVFVILLILHFWYFFETVMRLKTYPEFASYKMYLIKERPNLTGIEKGDLLIIRNTIEGKPGDIVLYLNNNSKYELARLISKNSVSVEIKKDSDEASTTMNSSVVIGKAVKKVSNFTNIIKIFGNKLVVVAFGLIGFIFVVFAQERMSRPKQIN